ncbi:MAG: HAMP domain-containing histidine kinase [Chloroflexi bacterium]|nr:HAMP domain-containing histidine kinase [Chloroflexota bacterium]
MSPARRISSFIWNVPVGLQLSVVYALLLTTVLVLLGFVLYSQLDSFLIQNTVARLDRTTSLSLAQLSPSPFDREPIDRSAPDFTSPRDRRPPRSPEQVAAALVGGLSSSDVAVAVLAEPGKVITSTQSLLGGSPPYIPPLLAGWSARVASGSSAQWVVSAPGGGRDLVVLTPVKIAATPGSAESRLLVEQVASLEAADAVLNQLRLYLALGILIGVLVGVIAGLALTRVVLKPLERISRTAEAISGGDLDRRLRLPPGRNEVARLGHAFDSMVERLASTLEAQRRFVADASHELRTPLTSLDGLSEMLLMGADRGDSKIVQRSVRSMHSELSRLGRLVADLLTLSRLDSTAPTMVFQLLRPCGLLTGAVEQMTPVAEARGVHLAMQCDPVAQMALLRADPDRLKQVLLNLLDNALRYTPAGGKVCVKVTADSAQRRLQITVQDTGQGVLEQDLPHVFDRFFRGDPSRARATGNTGLGLSIARAIVLAHGGVISVESPPGRGACFTISLPLAKVDAAQEAVMVESR